MRIVMMMIVISVGMMFATTGFAGNDAKSPTETAEAATEKTPAVQAAPPDTKVVAPIEEADADAAYAKETGADTE